MKKAQQHFPNFSIDIMEHAFYFYSITDAFYDDEYLRVCFPLLHTPLPEVIILSGSTIEEMDQQVQKRGMVVFTYRKSIQNDPSPRLFYVLSQHPILSILFHLIPDELVPGQSDESRYLFPLIRMIRFHLYQKMVQRKIDWTYQQCKNITEGYGCIDELALPLLESLYMRYYDSSKIKQSIDQAHHAISEWYAPDGPGCMIAQREFEMVRIILSEMI